MAAAGKEFDLNKRYKVILSERLKNQTRDPEYAVASVHVDTESKLPTSIKSSTIKKGFARNECSIDLIGATGSERLSFKGSQDATKSCALIFDPATQSFTLERIDTDFTFGQGQHSPTSDIQSEDGILNALIDQEGAGDAANPYDWRHQLKRQRTPTPELEPFDPLGVDALGTPSPEARPLKPKAVPRKASTPPEQPTMELEASASPEAEAEEEPQREEYEEEKEEGSDDGGLQIVMDGATKPRHRFRGRFTQRPDAAPISLRSAASSQSPALQNAGESEESDEDVDEMELDNPMTERRQEHGPESQTVQEPEEEAGDADEEDIDMDDEFAKALQGDDEDEPAAEGAIAPISARVDDSSSESEEE